MSNVPDLVNEISKETTQTKVVDTEATHRSFSNLYNEETSRKQLIHEELNSAMNWYPIIQAIKAGHARDVADEPKADKAPCFILGSGPSLDHSVKFLKQWEGGIICSTSQALTLMHHDIEPTHIVALDPFCNWSEIRGVDWSKTRTKLVVQPGVWPDLIEKWPNEMLLFLTNNGRPGSFYSTTQKHMYTWREETKEGGMRLPIFHFYIRTEMTLFASSVSMELFIADKLGYGTVFLAGLDFGYPKRKGHFDRYFTDADGNWQISHDDEPIENNPTAPPLLMANNGVLTRPIHLYYKKNWISAWRLSEQTVYTTDHGILTEVPFTNIEKVIKKQGKNYPAQSHAMIERITEKYLASVGGYVVQTSKGLSFVECVNPLHNIFKCECGNESKYLWDINVDTIVCNKCNKKMTLTGPCDLYTYMVGMIRQYGCTKCGATAVSNDNKEHTGEPCPNCKAEAMQRLIEVDLIGQMRKFERLLGMERKREEKKKEEKVEEVKE